MTVKLHKRALDHAKQLIEAGAYVSDDKDAWSEHQPTTRQENEFLRQHGFGEYGKWFLGIDEEEEAETKGRYKFPYGDFVKVHRCGVLAAENRAGQYKYTDIEVAAAHLHGQLDALRERQRSSP